MNRRHLAMVGLCLLSLAIGPRLARASQPASSPQKQSPEAAAADALALAARIDRLIAARWAARGVKPAESGGEGLGSDPGRDDG